MLFKKILGAPKICGPCAIAHSALACRLVLTGCKENAFDIIHKGLACSRANLKVVQSLTR